MTESPTRNFSEAFKRSYGRPEDLELVEERLAQLRKAHVETFDGFSVSPVSTLPTLVFMFFQCGIRRMAELTESTIEQLERRHVPSFCSLARSAYETGCLLYDVKSRIVDLLEGGFDADALDQFRDSMRTTALGSGPKAKTFYLFEDLKVTNILTVIQRIDKQYGEDAEAAATMGFYEGLSEHAHPNYHGLMSPFFARQHAGVAHFVDGKSDRVEAATTLVIYALSTALDFAELAYRTAIGALVPLAALAERREHEAGRWPAGTPFPVVR